MGESTRFQQALDNSEAVELTGKIMVVAIIVFFVVIVFVVFLHLYAKWFWWRIEEDHTEAAAHNGRRRRRFSFAPGQDPTAAAVIRRGLEPSVLRSLPVVAYRAEDFANGLECAVCLSELADGEKARLLPKCSHGFHVDCIDMWFQSHATCPLCRSSVAAEKSASAEIAEEVSEEAPDFPTNVLFWGNQAQVSSGNACLEEEEEAGSTSGPSSSSSTPSNVGVLAIDIPSASSSSSASASASIVSPSGEELKSPVTTRLRSLKRLLSREKRVSPCSPNSGGGDIEQGNRGPS